MRISGSGLSNEGRDLRVEGSGFEVGVVARVLQIDLAFLKDIRES